MTREEIGPAVVRHGGGWQVGELARATGLTVRTLHHYDRLGLLTPARDSAGRRCYTAADVRRLHRIVALRGFGLTLGEIGLLLAGSGPDPREVLRRQLEQAEERIAVAQRLRGSVLGVLSALGRLGAGAPTGGQRDVDGMSAGHSAGRRRFTVRSRAGGEVVASRIGPVDRGHARAPGFTGIGGVARPLA